MFLSLIFSLGNVMTSVSLNILKKNKKDDEKEFFSKILFKGHKRNERWRSLIFQRVEKFFVSFRFVSMSNRWRKKFSHLIQKSNYLFLGSVVELHRYSLKHDDDDDSIKFISGCFGEFRLIEQFSPSHFIETNSSQIFCEISDKFFQKFERFSKNFVEKHFLFSSHFDSIRLDHFYRIDAEDLFHLRNEFSLPRIRLEKFSIEKRTKIDVERLSSLICWFFKHSNIFFFLFHLGNVTYRRFTLFVVVDHQKFNEANRNVKLKPKRRKKSVSKEKKKVSLFNLNRSWWSGDDGR